MRTSYTHFYCFFANLHYQKSTYGALMKHENVNLPPNWAGLKIRVRKLTSWYTKDDRKKKINFAYFKTYYVGRYLYRNTYLAIRSQDRFNSKYNLLVETAICFRQVHYTPFRIHVCEFRLLNFLLEYRTFTKLVN